MQEQNTEGARQLSLSFLYLLQMEAPRPDGGLGYPGLRLRGDVTGSAPDGLALAPYVRSSRRIRAESTVLEQHIAYPLRPAGPVLFPDSVGVGCYRIDLHPRTNGCRVSRSWLLAVPDPAGFADSSTSRESFARSKNLGTTHITNGAFRVHPVEWNVGEVAGLLAAFCLERNVEPRSIRCLAALLEEFQALLQGRGIELSWPSLTPV